MKKTKKLLACLIAAATMFTMGSTAFAATTDQETVTVNRFTSLQMQEQFLRKKLSLYSRLRRKL